MKHLYECNCCLLKLKVFLKERRSILWRRFEGYQNPKDRIKIFWANPSHGLVDEPQNGHPEGYPIFPKFCIKTAAIQKL